KPSTGTAPPKTETAPPVEEHKLKIVFVEVCADSGALATPYCPERVKKPFIAGTEPKKYCPIHHPPK
ncbi:MAG TPA: hypothetical protein VNI20_10000, partial [Fimbriimonadaceae bacterium]|nr:hypothetical protein [Fimbriimonadaceae bacterium]